MNSNLCRTISHLSSNTQLKPVIGSNRRGSFTSGRGRGRGETLNTSSVNGTLSKRRPVYTIRAYSIVMGTIFIMTNYNIVRLTKAIRTYTF